MGKYIFITFFISCLLLGILYYYKVSTSLSILTPEHMCRYTPPTTHDYPTGYSEDYLYVFLSDELSHCDAKKIANHIHGNIVAYTSSGGCGRYNNKKYYVIDTSKSNQESSEVNLNSLKTLKHVKQVMSPTGYMLSSMCIP